MFGWFGKKKRLDTGTGDAQFPEDHIVQTKIANLIEGTGSGLAFCFQF